MFSVYSIKKQILKQSNDCGYILNKSHEPFKNITRIESMKGHFQQIKINNNIDNEIIKNIDEWINSLESKFINI